MVSSLSPSEIEESFGIRMQLETWLFVAAIPRMTEMDFARAEVVIEEASKTGDFENWSALNWRFTRRSKRKRQHDRVEAAALGPRQCGPYVILQLAVIGDVEHELSDHHAMLAYARLATSSAALIYCVDISLGFPATS